MKDEFLVVAIGIVVCLCLIAFAVIATSAQVDECRAKGGTLTKTVGSGLVCIKAEVLP